MASVKMSMKFSNPTKVEERPKASSCKTDWQSACEAGQIKKTSVMTICGVTNMYGRILFLNTTRFSTIHFHSTYSDAGLLFIRKEPGLAWLDLFIHFLEFTQEFIAIYNCFVQSLLGRLLACKDGFELIIHNTAHLHEITKPKTF